MVGDSDTPPYFQRSSICCEALFHAKSHSLESGADLGMTYQRGPLASISLEVFADADYASKATDRRSVSGGACVCWVF